MIYELKFAKTHEYGLVAVFGVFLGLMFGILHVSYLERLGHSETTQMTALVTIITLSVVLSLLGKYLLLRRKNKNRIVCLSNSGRECYMPLDAYAFPFPEGVEETCVIERSHAPTIVDSKTKVWSSGNGWVDVEPKKLSEFDLEPGQRYYIALALDEERDAVVRDESRGWWPHKIVSVS